MAKIGCRTNKFFIVGLALILGLALFLPVKTSAASSEVVVNICGLPQPLNLNVQQPKNDTVVGQPHVLIKGVANQQAQLDVYLNDQLNDSLSTEADGTFTTSLVLNQGTNTIKITGASFCGGTTNNITLVLTYTPGAAEQSGGVATQIPGISYQVYNSSQQPQTGVVIQPKNSTKNVEKRAPVKQRIQNMLHASSDSVKQVYDVVAMLLIIGGGTMIVAVLGLAGMLTKTRIEMQPLHWRLIIGGGFLLILGILLLLLML